MECFDAVDAVYWRHYDYAKIPQFHGCRFLYGIRGGDFPNVLFIVFNVSGGCGR